MSAPQYADPVEIAWKASPHNGEFPKSLQQSASTRAGCANGALGHKGKGKHTLAVCV